MTVEPRPLIEADFHRVEAVFTDVDGTLTSADKLRSGTVRAIEELQAAGVRVVLVSGRPAGWGECWARTLPVDGVIVENGGLYYARRKGQLRKEYAQPASFRLKARARLVKAVNAAMLEVPGARLSSDSAHTEVDLAIDYNEEARLGPEAAGKLEAFLRRRRIQAVRSSVHVNCWIGRFNKLTMVKRFCAREWDLTVASRDTRLIYVGDSFNDAPMFEAFPLSVGVANVRAALATIDHPPAFITRQREGEGFCEVARQVLEARALVTPKHDVPRRNG
jgi:HAD superfamily hydrolase (TIGR01484 family)